jgi:hypothetical protein
MLLGSIGMMSAAAVQPTLAAWARYHRAWRALWAADALYTYLSLWVCVLFWRGVWAYNEILCGTGAPPTAPDTARALSGGYSHGVGVVVLLVLGALRNTVACPMLISSDASAPIFGAGVTAGLSRLSPFERYRQPPEVQTAEEWHKAVGVPYTAVCPQPRADLRI